MSRRVLHVVFVFSSCISISLSAASAFQGNTTAPAKIQAKTETVTLAGTIDYMQSNETYMIKSTNPDDEVFVVNPNPKVLKALKESGKSVTIEGHYTSQGADYFFIEKIDGKKYRGSKPAK